jgi:hypothetical protein
MRTTVNIPDHLLIEAKRMAATRRTSLASVIADSLRRYLAETRAAVSVKEPVLMPPVVRAGRLVEGVDLDDTSRLVEL